MRIVFFGTPIFAAQNLKYLIENNFDISAVVTTQDQKKGRGKKLTISEVKKVALQNNITIIEYNILLIDNIIKKLKKINAELFVVVAFKKLPINIWSLPKMGTINLHASLLPDYKGAAPINRVLINGEKETGLTTFFINSNIDSGDTIKNKKIFVNEDLTAAQLHNLLIEEGNILLASTLKTINNGNYTRKEQLTNIQIKKAPKLNKDILKIDWNKSVKEIHNLVRGLSPYLNKNEILKNISILPSAWFIIASPDGNKKRIKIQLTRIEGKCSKPHLSILTDNKSFLHIAIHGQYISLLQLQPEGKNSMNIKQFLQGNMINNDCLIL